MRRVLFLFMFLLPGLALAAAPTPAQILAQAKAASGGDAWNDVHTLRLQGTIETGGLSGTFDELEDLATGRSVTRFELGSLTGAQGFDGTMGWNKSPGGEVSPDDSPAAKQADITSAYQTAQGWWYPKRWPAKIESLGTRKDDGKTYQVLRIAPDNGRPFELWIDAKTHLAARTVEATGMGSVEMTAYFSDYRTVHGAKIAFHQLVSNGKKQYDQVIQVKRIDVNVPVSAADFAMPKQEFKDFSIAGGADEATIPFKLVNNHLFIQVTVNGHPLQFMLDSGGANILMPAAAKSAGIQSKGALEGGGVGKKSVNTGFGKVKDLTLGGKVTLSNQLFGVLPIPGFDWVEGTRFDGLVGYEVFKRFVVRIDYAAQKLTFMLPKDFKPADAGTAVPFVFLGHIPGIKGSIDGIPGEFEIDTGSRAGLSLLAPFVKAHDLDSRYKTTPATVVGWGVGGGAHGRVARGGTLMIGSVAVHDPVVELSTATKGAFAEKQVAGNIGGAILKHFTVTFDYANQTMYLKPNKDHGAPMNYDRSGMWINATAAGFVVKALMSGGPAARAGLKVGDVITAVDGKPASGIALSDMRAMLRDDAPGTKVKLAVGHAGKTRSVTLVLRRLIPQTGGLAKAG